MMEQNLIELTLFPIIFITSVISGTLGMGGGLMLMAFLNYFLPVNMAMIVHGWTQFFSNGSRAIIHKEAINWKLIPTYLLGSLIAFLLFYFLEISASKNLIYILLGAFPFLIFLKKVAKTMSITRPYRPFISGIIVMMAQLLAGASGSILDLFYLESPLKKETILANKALTQTVGHLIKIIFYLNLNNINFESSKVSVYFYILVIPVSFFGNKVGKIINDLISEEKFKKFSKVFILILAILLISKGFALSESLY